MTKFHEKANNKIKFNSISTWQTKTFIIWTKNVFNKSFELRDCWWKLYSEKENAKLRLRQHLNANLVWSNTNSLSSSSITFPKTNNAFCSVIARRRSHTAKILWKYLKPQRVHICLPQQDLCFTDCLRTKTRVGTRWFTSKHIFHGAWWSMWKIFLNFIPRSWHAFAPKSKAIWIGKLVCGKAQSLWIRFDNYF